MAAKSNDELAEAGCLVPLLTATQRGTAAESAWTEGDAVHDPELAVPVASAAKVRDEARDAVAGTEAEPRTRRPLLATLPPGRLAERGAVPDEPDGEDEDVVRAAVVVPRRTRW